MNNSTPPDSIYEEEKRYLKQIHQLLSSSLILPCEFREDEETGCTLTMPMALEGASADVSLAIQLQKQPLGEQDFETGEKIPVITSISFAAALPLHVPQPQLIDVLLLLNFLNTTYPLAGFQIDLIEMRPFFKYVLVSSISDINKTVLLSIVGAIILAVNQYLPFIQAVASKEMTLEQVFEKFLPESEEL